MGDEFDKALAGYRAGIEARLHEDINRHRSVDPNLSTAQVKAIARKREVERFDRPDTPKEIRDAMRVILDDILKRL